MAADATSTLTEEQCSGGLPSKSIYKKLDVGQGGCDGEANIQGIEEKLKSYVENVDHMNRIKKALCYVSEMEKDNTNRKEDYCYALYFWVGEILPKELGELKFQKAISDYQTKIQVNSKKYGCTPPSLSNKPEFFTKLKKLFDYKVDRTFIESNVSKEGKPCPAKYQAYLEEVQGAYKVMQQECTEGYEEDWCVDFMKWCPEYRNEENLESGCKPVDTAKHRVPVEQQQEQQQEQEHASSDVSASGTGTTIAIPSTMATLALPTAAFFLYKYTNLFSAKRGTVSPKRRKRRSANTNFDNTSNDDDTSTYNSTYDSTEASTIANSMTDASTIYNGRPPPLRARNNNGWRRNVAYQRM
ncbi:KIR protein [Plasmodium coatneyi]|uniref:KIR protein n=1 Tax=Plasmodium coatneyi TaxID=208452 RepID=A0A1B1E6S2_9APIC|nr:KIR protein [Plasmodium coatneyi]ANQ10667.1 KIR protein [Plasmodium coatneyi]